MNEPKRPAIGENHRRVISNTLRLTDRMLCRFRLWGEGQEVASVLFHLQNDLSPAQRERIRQVVAEAQAIIVGLLDEFGLAGRVQLVSQLIRGDCGCAWSDLQEITSHHLRGYGEPSPELARELDPRLGALCETLKRLEDVVAENDAGPPGGREKPPA